MDFIERWLHISPDGGSGVSETLILVVLIATGLIVVSLRNYFPKNFIEYLKQLGSGKTATASTTEISGQGFSWRLLSCCGENGSSRTLNPPMIAPGFRPSG